MSTLTIVLLIVAAALWIAGFALQHKRLKIQRRRAELEHMQREIDFMGPIFKKLNTEALGHWLDGDFKAYEKTRKRILALQKRWNREVTSKLHRTDHEQFIP